MIEKKTGQSALTSAITAGKPEIDARLIPPGANVNQKTPDGDTPLWWSNWRVTDQDVAAGTRISGGTPICVSATK